MTTEILPPNIPYFVSIALLLIGLFCMITKRNLIKKVMGFNIFSTSVLLFLVSIGYRRGAAPPIEVEGVTFYVNPLPHALVLTGIVVALALTSFALILIINIYKEHKTLDSEKLKKL